MGMYELYLACETLKMRFNSLFLTSYDLPDVSEVCDFLDETFCVIDSQEKFRATVDRLERLVVAVELREADLLTFSHNGFLGKFCDIETESDGVFPYDKKRSGEEFFDKFFNGIYSPTCEKSIEEMVESCLFVVQYVECDEGRVRDAMVLLKAVKKFIQGRNENTLAPCKHVEDDLHFYDDENDDAALAMDQSSQQFDVHDYCFNVDGVPSKGCTCHEYEVSGDCGCMYDC